jgi:hypothetical protein
MTAPDLIDTSRRVHPLSGSPHQGRGHPRHYDRKSNRKSFSAALAWPAGHAVGGRSETAPRYILGYIAASAVTKT